MLEYHDSIVDMETAKLLSGAEYSVPFESLFERFESSKRLKRSNVADKKDVKNVAICEPVVFCRFAPA